MESDETKSADAGSDRQVEEVTLKDGSKIVIVDGVPYGEADVRAAKREAGLRRLGDEALGCGLSAAWIYIGLPVIALLLIGLVVGLGSCTGLLRFG